MITKDGCMFLAPQDLPPMNPELGTPMGLRCDGEILKSHTEIGEDGNEVLIIDAFNVLSVNYVYDMRVKEAE